jgi:hypothetical protein
MPMTPTGSGTGTSLSARVRTGASARTSPRMNLRVAFDVIAQRLHDVKLAPGAEIDYHSTMNRAPLSVPITFTPGQCLGRHCAWVGPAWVIRGYQRGCWRS